LTSPSGGRGAADRVRVSHTQTRTTLRLALLFIAAAAIAGVTGSRWLALHLFLAGAVVLAISGVSLMLTVTWSAAPAPADAWVAVQRACIAVGAAGIAAGRQAELPDPVIAVAGSSYVAGLALLAVLLVVTVRRGVERRFDVAVAFYVAAATAGTVGVMVGTAMAVNTPEATTRAVHVTVNLLGLVGLVVAGTMPFFAATVGRSRMSPHAKPSRLVLLLCWQLIMLTITVSALVAERGSLAAVGLTGYALGVVAVMALLPHPTRRQLLWAGPRVLALWTGGAWWAVAVAASAVDAASDHSVFGGRWLVVLVIGGYAQILWGSLAYLLPMLRGGGHQLLGEGFATTRSWVGLAAANAAALSAALALPTPITIAAVAVWVLDGAWRAARVGTTRATRPT
jgi:nitrite reductase (NO-forming)